MLEKRKDIYENQEGDFGEQRLLLFDGMCSVDACNPDDEDMEGGLDEEEQQLVKKLKKKMQAERDVNKIMRQHVI